MRHTTRNGMPRKLPIPQKVSAPVGDAPGAVPMSRSVRSAAMTSTPTGECAAARVASSPRPVRRERMRFRSPCSSSAGSRKRSV